MPQDEVTRIKARIAKAHRRIKAGRDITGKDRDGAPVRECEVIERLTKVLAEKGAA